MTQHSHHRNTRSPQSFDKHHSQTTWHSQDLRRLGPPTMTAAPPNHIPSHNRAAALELESLKRAPVTTGSDSCESKRAVQNGRLKLYQLYEKTLTDAVCRDRRQRVWSILEGCGPCSLQSAMYGKRFCDSIIRSSTSSSLHPSQMSASDYARRRVEENIQALVSGSSRRTALEQHHADKLRNRLSSVTDYRACRHDDRSSTAKMKTTTEPRSHRVTSQPRMEREVGPAEYAHTAAGNNGDGRRQCGIVFPVQRAVDPTVEQQVDHSFQPIPEKHSGHEADRDQEQVQGHCNIGGSNETRYGHNELKISISSTTDGEKKTLLMKEKS
jgi:hypothetical protein